MCPLPEDTTRTKRQHSILLHLSEEEQRRLEYVANALGLSVSETLRSLIPNIRLPDRQTVATDAEIAAAAPFDIVPFTGRPDRPELADLLNKISAFGFASTLAREIRQQVLEAGADHLTVETYKRLGRWCHPHRWTQRETEIKPLARRISEMLFGRIIDRLA